MKVYFTLSTLGELTVYYLQLPGQFNRASELSSYATRPQTSLDPFSWKEHYLLLNHHDHFILHFSTQTITMYFQIFVYMS